MHISRWYNTSAAPHKRPTHTRHQRDPIKYVLLQQRFNQHFEKWPHRTADDLTTPHQEPPLHSAEVANWSPGHHTYISIIPCRAHIGAIPLHISHTLAEIWTHDRTLIYIWIYSIYRTKPKVVCYIWCVCVGGVYMVHVMRRVSSDWCAMTPLNCNHTQTAHIM